MRTSRRRPSRARALGLWLLLAPLLWSTAAMGQDWVEVTSPQFRVITDQGGRDARRVARDLERIRRLYQHVLPQAVSDPMRPVLAVLVEDEDDLAAWLPRYADGVRPAGVFLQGAYSHLIVLRRDSDIETVYHEYLHLLTSLNVKRLPPWLTEGLAEFYASAEFVGSKAKFGLVDQSGLDHLRSRTLISLEELVGRTDNPHASGDVRTIQVFYAQAWALTHYLMIGNQELADRGALSNYIELVQDGVDQVEAFVQVVGPLDDVREALRVYTRRLMFPIVEVEMGEDIDGGVFGERDLPRAEVLAERGIALAMMGHHELADADVEEARRIAPESPVVLVAAGIASMRHDQAAASEAFSEALRLNSQSYVPYYLLGSTRLRDEGPALTSDDRIRLLRRATALNPRFAPAYQELSRVLVLHGDAEQAFQVARAAVDLDQTSAYSWMLMGHAALEANQPDAARLAAESGLSWVQDEAGVESLRGLLEDVDEHEAFVRAERRASEVRAPTETEVEPATPVSRNRESAPPSPPTSIDPSAEALTLSGTWTELRCINNRIDFVIAAHNPPTTLVLSSSAPAPVEVLGADGTVEERIFCGPQAREVTVEFAILSISSGTVRGRLIQLSFP